VTGRSAASPCRVAPTAVTEPPGHTLGATVDTTEVRWFTAGALPPSILRWFTGSTGALEERHDTYLLDDRVDVGIKYRGGTLLELKVRQRVGRRTDVGPGLTGPLEMWRKWTGADDLVDITTSATWVDVHKIVVKRRFSLDGTEVAFSHDQGVGPACDVEVAAVTVGSYAAWTLAFASFGPLRSRRPAVLASWRTLTAGTSVPPIELDAARAMGYPEWLCRTVTARSQGRERDGSRSTGSRP
jgi:hypothetical protein